MFFYYLLSNIYYLSSHLYSLPLNYLTIIQKKEDVNQEKEERGRDERIQDRPRTIGHPPGKRREEKHSALAHAEALAHREEQHEHEPLQENSPRTERTQKEKHHESAEKNFVEKNDAESEQFIPEKREERPLDGKRKLISLADRRPCLISEEEKSEAESDRAENPHPVRKLRIHPEAYPLPRFPRDESRVQERKKQEKNSEHDDALHPDGEPVRRRKVHEKQEGEKERAACYHELPIRYDIF